MDFKSWFVEKTDGALEGAGNMAGDAFDAVKNSVNLDFGNILDKGSVAKYTEALSHMGTKDANHIGQRLLGLNPAGKGIGNLGPQTQKAWEDFKTKNNIPDTVQLRGPDGKITAEAMAVLREHGTKTGTDFKELKTFDSALDTAKEKIGDTYNNVKDTVKEAWKNSTPGESMLNMGDK
ncbi:MAG: hypothetical protein H6861_07770 [Rhodospirillales bacterium]|nr:hypothetical protein [Rhodospirillales bacterium]